MPAPDTEVGVAASDNAEFGQVVMLFTLTLGPGRVFDCLFLRCYEREESVRNPLTLRALSWALDNPISACASRSRLGRDAGVFRVVAASSVRRKVIVLPDHRRNHGREARHFLLHDMLGEPPAYLMPVVPLSHVDDTGCMLPCHTERHGELHLHAAACRGCPNRLSATAGNCLVCAGPPVEEPVRTRYGCDL
jgi:hypothetical protein